MRRWRSTHRDDVTAVYRDDVTALCGNDVTALYGNDVTAHYRDDVTAQYWEPGKELRLQCLQTASQNRKCNFSDSTQRGKCLRALG